MNIENIVDSKIKTGDDYLFRQVCVDICTAYSETQREEGYSLRWLNYFCRTPLNLVDAAKVAKVLVDQPNDFNWEKIYIIGHYFGEGAQIFFARENSVCLYVKPSRRITSDELTEFKEASLCDELAYYPDLGLFRVWWD